MYRDPIIWLIPTPHSQTKQLWEIPAVRITIDLNSLDRAIARQKTARVAAAVRGAVVAAF